MGRTLGAYKLQVNNLEKTGIGKTIAGQELGKVACYGDTTKVNTPVHETVTKQLIVARFNVDLQTKTGCTPLQYTVHKGHETVTEHLIVAHCNVDLHQRKGYTTLHFAALQGLEVVTKQLIAARSNVDLQDKRGATALQTC